MTIAATNKAKRKETHMNRIEIEASTDETGRIRVRLASAPPHHPVHVVVEWEDPRVDGPPGKVEATPASITDPTFVPPMRAP